MQLNLVSYFFYKNFFDASAGGITQIHHHGQHHDQCQQCESHSAPYAIKQSCAESFDQVHINSPTPLYTKYTANTTNMNLLIWNMLDTGIFFI